MKKNLLLILTLLLGIGLTACVRAGSLPVGTQQTTTSSPAPISTQTPTSTPEQIIAPPASASASQSAEPADDSVLYENSEYQFSFTLPAGWKGYSILSEKWEGLAVSGKEGEKVAETGPMLSIRHPEWTETKPRQDIPIMIFTRDQWDRLQTGDFHIGAAPVDPTKLGSNDRYVFALPARYNFAFPEGYEEVEQIIQSNPLHTETGGK